MQTFLRILDAAIKWLCASIDAEAGVVPHFEKKVEQCFQMTNLLGDHAGKFVISEIQQFGPISAHAVLK